MGERQIPISHRSNEIQDEDIKDKKVNPLPYFERKNIKMKNSPLQRISNRFCPLKIVFLTHLVNPWKT